MHAESLHGTRTEPAAPTAARLRGVLARAGRELLYLTIGLGTSILAFTVGVVGVSVTLSLIIFIIGLPVALLTAAGFRAVAELDRRNAGLLLGAPLRGRYRDHSGRFMVRLSATWRDPQTWRDFAWIVLHSIVGFVFGVVAVTSVGYVVGIATLPAWYWALPDGYDLGLYTVDTFGEALVTALLALPLAAVAVGLIRVMALGESRLAAVLLGPRADAAPTATMPAQAPGDEAPTVALPAHAALPEATPAPPRIDGDGILAIQLTISAIAGFVCTLLWGLTGQGTFWPMWVWFGVGVPVALHYAIRIALREEPGRRRWFALDIALCAVAAATLVVLWLLAGGGTFWPLWPLIGLAGVLAIHLVVDALYRRLTADVRERELAERVDVLTRTRRGALDVQAAELRRIERDLHDGAQARLVALTMQLGRAEERLADQPEIAEEFRKARGEASAAIAELRDLARGIAPPVLADRGLAAAAEALGRRSAIPVTVEADIGRRPLPVIETAAYFVVAEGLTNVAKHAPRASAQVRIAERGDVLSVEIADDGPGGAYAEGNGLSGLRGRVEALDGRLTVDSPAGAGTTIRAELPCGS